MDPFSKALVASYMGGLGLLGIWGGAVAWAQDTALAGVAQASIAGNPVTLDLGNITLPGAIVICVGMILRVKKLPVVPIRVAHYHYDVDEPTNHGDTGSRRRRHVTDDVDGDDG